MPKAPGALYSLRATGKIGGHRRIRAPRLIPEDAIPLDGIPPFDADAGSAGVAATASRSDHYHGAFVRRRTGFPMALWHQPGWYSAGFQYTALMLSRLIYIPIYVSHDQTFTGIGIYVSAATPPGFIARLGIYNTVNGFPASLNLDAGTVSVATTGDKIIVLSHPLGRGLYNLAIVTNHVPTLGGPSVSLAISPAPTGFSGGGVLGGNLVLSAASGQGGAPVGGLPDPAPTPSMTLASNNAFVALRS